MNIKLQNLEFEPFILDSQIQQRIKEVADEINETYENTPCTLVVVLNGSFRFVADLTRHLKMPCEFVFIRLKSYQNMESSGEIQEVLGLNIPLKNKNVLIIEDIIDTGNTISELLSQFKLQEPTSLRVATLLFKPFALQKPIGIDFIGFEIENKFVVGYGLDYNETGRELNDLYVLKEDEKND
jgi:hypoxanthine phosphoribosyltransferase